MSAALLKHPAILLLVVFLSLVPCGHTESPISIEREYVRTDFTVDQGLPNNKVNAILQTGNGLLWVATASGLASFDGHNFTQAPLRIPGAAPAESVNALAIGADGDLWVGTDAGIVRIPKSDLNSPYLAVTKGYRLGSALSDEVVALFCAHDGTVWAGTNHGLYRFNGQEFHRSLDVPFVSRIHQAHDGTLLLITSQGFMEYAGTRLTAHPELPRRFGVPEHSIFEALQSSDGTMWFGTFKGIHNAGGHEKSLIASIVDAEPAYRGYVSPDGTLWFSTGIGLFRVNGRNLENPAPGQKVRTAFMGGRGDIWIGTTGSGIVHLQPRVVRNYTTADGMLSTLTNTVLSARDGRIWVGNNCGVAVLDGDSLRTYAEKDGLSNACVDALAEDNDHDIWLGSSGGGLFQFHENVFRQYSIKQGLISNYVTTITVATDNSLWIGTPDGLSHYQTGHITNYNTADGLSSNRILDIHEDKQGVLWVATQGGIDKLSFGRFIPIPSLPSREEILSRRFVEDSRRNLYTTDVPRGLSRIQNDRSVLINDSLALFDAVEASDGHLWFSSLHGIIGLSESELARLGSSDAPISFRQIDRVEGMISSQAMGGSPDIALAKNGVIWVATGKGLAAIDTKRISQTSERANVFVAGVRVDREQRHVGGTLELSPGPHHVEFRLAAVDLQTPEKVRFQYRLQGVDSTWLDADESRTAVYTGLPPGTHQFMVRAADSLGVWSGGINIYEVVQHPFLYQTRTFLISLLAGFTACLWVIYEARVRLLMLRARTIQEERQVEREAMAHDLHDTFLQSVQGLFLRFQTGTSQLPSEVPGRQILEEALSRSDLVMIQGREILLRLHSSSIGTESLSDAFEAFVKEFNPYVGPEVKILSAGHQTLSRVVQGELYRLGREAIFNALRHAQARHINVEILCGDVELQIKVCDDGKGIESEVLKKGAVDGHFGLPGMRERTTRIGGGFRLRSELGIGTEVHISLPASIAYLRKEENVFVALFRTWKARLM